MCRVCVMVIVNAVKICIISPEKTPRDSVLFGHGAARVG